ncbi:MAG TPA: sigma 54-interacting transcriptional regulator [Verrucomicrobiae bacterium]|nr:sigma 54-interacting transcriptional regulator [Verrucomicrobiae bacterium]
MKIEALQSIMLAIGQARSVSQVLQLIAEGVSERPNTALVRIWLTGPGDLCHDCHFRQQCPNQTRCLHLAASAGRSRSNQDMTEINGRFRRIPWGVFKTGCAAATAQPFLIPKLDREDLDIQDPLWVEEQAIQSFAGQPLIFREEVLGMLALFERAKITPEEFRWLRTFADHAAVAIVNARAFEEIEQLKRRLEVENDYLREEMKEALNFGDIVGNSSALRKVLYQIDLVARTEANVLILGESGTGKELVARAIHERSPRKKHPLIKVNCGAVPGELFESEFFGHVKGAFTSAIKDRIGRFELADGGTLFLDEVGEIPLSLQAKLLRILQEHQFERVGEERTRTANVRVVAATNRDLKQEVEAGRFRQDLFYRLSVFPIEIPPLRERREDIPILAAHFLNAAAKRLNVKAARLTQAQARALSAYDWPGNVRELQNVIERAVILSQDGPLHFELALASVKASRSRAQVSKVEKIPVVTREGLKQHERESIRAALAQTQGKVFGPGGAADILGMKGTTLASRIKALGLKRT